MPILDWIGKKAVENHHRQVPFHLLKDVPELSVGDPGSGNLLVEGDNLVALKALLPYYAGQVKCIYIDPPYNTGNEGWIYNDNVNSPEIRDWLGKTVGGELDDLSRHDKWLCMIYPRLMILKHFLTEDGAIIVHIDENEIDHCFTILSEIFGRNNSLGYLVWDKGNPKGDSQGIAFQHESLYVFAKNKKNFLENSIVHRRKPNAEKMIGKASQIFKKIGKISLPDDLKEINKIYKLPSQYVDSHKRLYTLEDANNEFQSWLKKQDGLSGGEAMYKYIDNGGRTYRLVSMAWPNKKKAPDEYFRPLKHPVTKKECPVPERGWRYPPKTIEELIEKKLIQFGNDHNTQPQRIYYLDENMDENIPSILCYAGSDDAYFRDMNLHFENPKPFKFAMQILNAFSGKESIILDSFAGSGTTGHAVMQLNKEDGGNRKFVLVEMNSSICSNVTAKRLKNVCEGYKKVDATKVDGIEGGFRFCQLGEPIFDEKGNIRNTVRFADLARHVYFTETGAPLPKQSKTKTSLLGIHNGLAVYLLYNGILKDKAPDGGNVLTTSVLARLPKHDGPKVIYGTACKLGVSRLRKQNITFKQLPYKLKVDAL